MKLTLKIKIMTREIEFGKFVLRLSTQFTKNFRLKTRWIGNDRDYFRTAVILFGIGFHFDYIK